MDLCCSTAASGASWLKWDSNILSINFPLFALQFLLRARQINNLWSGFSEPKLSQATFCNQSCIRQRLHTTFHLLLISSFWKAERRKGRTSPLLIFHVWYVWLWLAFGREFSRSHSFSKNFWIHPEKGAKNEIFMLKINISKNSLTWLSLHSDLNLN